MILQYKPLLLDLMVCFWYLHKNCSVDLFCTLANIIEYKHRKVIIFNSWTVYVFIKSILIMTYIYQDVL